MALSKTLVAIEKRSEYGSQIADIFADYTRLQAEDRSCSAHSILSGRTTLIQRKSSRCLFTFAANFHSMNQFGAIVFIYR